MLRVLKLFLAQLRAMFCDEGVVLVMVGAPLIYGYIYSLCYGAEIVRNIPIAVVDTDHTPQSREFVRTLGSGDALKVDFEPLDIPSARGMLERREIDAIIYIPSDFGRDILTFTPTKVKLYVDASNFMTYRKILEHTANVVDGWATEPQPILSIERNLYNPQLGYGSYVLEPIYVLVIQQTCIIALAMFVRGRRYGSCNKMI